MNKIDRRASACPVPPRYSLQFYKAEDGEAHGIRVGDRVRYKSQTSGVFTNPVGRVSHIEILRDDAYDGEEVYARFYIETGVLHYWNGTPMHEISGIHGILEIVG